MDETLLSREDVDARARELVTACGFSETKELLVLVVESMRAGARLAALHDVPSTDDATFAALESLGVSSTAVALVRLPYDQD